MVMRPLFLLLLFILSCLDARAMVLVTQDEYVFATGGVNDDLKRFENALANPQIKTVVFVNSPGGDLWTGLKVGRLIKEKQLNTVIAGYCNSACSIMFMGGLERRFANNLPHSATYIGIHGAHDKNTKAINPQAQPGIYAFYKEQLGQKFDSHIFNTALYNMDDAGALLRVFDVERKPDIKSYHCQSSQTPRDKCTTFPEADAMNLGITTHANLVTLEIPISILPNPTVMDRPLAEELTQAALSATLTQLQERACVTQRCQKIIHHYSNQTTHKSLATRISGKGFGISWEADSTNLAMLRALYLCNHAPNLPIALCETQLIDQTPTHSWYFQNDSETQTAFKNIQEPKEPYFANEEFGGDFVQWNSKFRFEKFEDMTPKVLPDVQTISTQALVRLLLSNDKPKLIDVLGSAHTIPTSQALIFGGNAFEDPMSEQAFHARFVALLKLLAPEVDKPVVFFCAGRNCWHSVNASLRAVQAGYTHVYWYRGGINSWNAAKLPTTPLVIRAVAN